jgi:hypothetical protein
MILLVLSMAMVLFPVRFGSDFIQRPRFVLTGFPAVSWHSDGFGTRWLGKHAPNGAGRSRQKR